MEKMHFSSYYCISWWMSHDNVNALDCELAVGYYGKISKRSPNKSDKQRWIQKVGKSLRLPGFQHAGLPTYLLSFLFPSLLCNHHEYRCSKKDYSHSFYASHKIVNGFPEFLKEQVQLHTMAFFRIVENTMLPVDGSMFSINFLDIPVTHLVFSIKCFSMVAIASPGDVSARQGF